VLLTDITLTHVQTLQAEAFAKTSLFGRDEGGLSAVNPERYAERFFDFMSRRLVI
jgi:hypothetical protein